MALLPIALCGQEAALSSGATAMDVGIRSLHLPHSYTAGRRSNGSSPGAASTVLSRGTSAPLCVGEEEEIAFVGFGGAELLSPSGLLTVLIINTHLKC